MMDKVLKVFTGRALPEPLEVKVRYRDSSVKALVFFGELKVPYLRLVDCEGLSEAYECTIKEEFPYYTIRPKIIDEIIENEGLLSSSDERHISLLEEWFKKHGVRVIAEVISEEGFEKVKRKG